MKLYVFGKTAFVVMGLTFLIYFLTGFGAIVCLSASSFICLKSLLVNP